MVQRVGSWTNQNKNLDTVKKRDVSVSRQGLVAGPCEHGNESLGPTVDGEFLD